MKRSQGASIAIALLSMLAISGCHSESSTPVENWDGTTAPRTGLRVQGIMPFELPVDVNNGARAAAAWMAQPGFLYIVTFGSSSCPTLASGYLITPGPENYTTIQLRETGQGGPCTADLSPTWSIVELPANKDDGQPIDIRVGDDILRVPPRVNPGEVGPVSELLN